MRTVKDLLQANGIKLERYSAGTHKALCPECSPQRKKKGDLCLYVNIKNNNEALWKCYNCQATGQVNTLQKSSALSQQKSAPARNYTRPSYTPPKEGKLPERAVKYLEKRGLSEKVALRNKLEYKSLGSGKTGEFLFPYVYQGDVINVKHRTDDKKFRLEKGAQLIFFGLDDVMETEEIYIVEGEFDKLALEEVGITNVISVPNGATVTKRGKDTDPADNTGGFAYLEHAMPTLQSAKKIILSVDRDEAGESLEYELSRRIGRDRCWRTRLPEKDANDVLVKHGKDVLREELLKAEPYPISGLYTVDDFYGELMEYYEHGMQSGVKTGFENIDNHYTVMEGRLTIVTGIPSHGKSEFVDALMVNLAEQHNWRHAVFSPEHQKEMHVAKLAEKHFKKSFNPKSKNRMTKDEFGLAANWVGMHFFFTVSEATGEEYDPTIDWILERAKAAVMRYGVKGVVIDPFNEIEHKRPKDVNEHEYIGQVLSKIKKFARLYSVHVWLVAHPTKMKQDEKGNDLIPNLYSVSGSANWANKADNGIVVHRPGGEGVKTEIHIKKIKFKSEGSKGVCTLEYNLETGRYDMLQSEKTYTTAEGNEVQYSMIDDEDYMPF